MAYWSISYNCKGYPWTYVYSWNSLIDRKYLTSFHDSKYFINLYSPYFRPNHQTCCYSQCSFDFELIENSSKLYYKIVTIFYIKYFGYLLTHLCIPIFFVRNRGKVASNHPIVLGPIQVSISGGGHHSTLVSTCHIGRANDAANVTQISVLT